MAFLDLFRPSWKHSDPAIRLKAVKKLTDSKILSKIADEDPDVAVRDVARQKQEPAEPEGVPCEVCGAMILPMTAERTGGFCMPCYKKSFSESYLYFNEEVPSSYGYPTGYKPKAITEQLDRLRELFPGIGTADEKLAEQAPPLYAEGWFAIPRWEKLADTYGEALARVLELIAKSREGEFRNVEKFTREYPPRSLLQTERTDMMLKTLGEQQGDHDVLVIPAQFGFRHRGRSVRRARGVFTANEFGLGALAVGIMLLTHPERLMDIDDLGINCAGDEYAGERVCVRAVLQVRPRGA